MLPIEATDIRNQPLMAYTVQCPWNLTTLPLTRQALQSVFEIRTSPSRIFFICPVMINNYLSIQL